jgi:hypothetical protein
VAALAEAVSVHEESVVAVACAVAQEGVGFAVEAGVLVSGAGLASVGAGLAVSVGVHVVGAGAGADAVVEEGEGLAGGALVVVRAIASVAAHVAGGETAVAVAVHGEAVVADAGVVAEEGVVLAAEAVAGGGKVQVRQVLLQVLQSPNWFMKKPEGQEQDPLLKTPLDLQLVQLLELPPLQVAQVLWQVTFTHWLVLLSKEKPELQTQVELFRKALALQEVQVVGNPTQERQEPLQVPQIPLAPMKKPTGQPHCPLVRIPLTVSLHVRHWLLLRPLQVLQVKSQEVQSPLVLKLEPLLQTQFPLTRLALALHAVQAPVEEQVAHWLLQVWQLPLPSMKKPALHEQKLLVMRSALFLQVEHWLLFGPEQVAQLLWQEP